MKFPGSQVVSAYKAALNGNVSYQLTNVPVYSWVPSDKTPPYIYISDFTDFTDFQGTCKDSFGHNTTTLLEIVTAFDGDTGTMKAVNEISDLVIRIIGDGLTLVADFQDVISNVDSFNIITEPVDDQVIIRGLLRMRNEIKEL